MEMNLDETAQRLWDFITENSTWSNQNYSECGSIIPEPSKRQKYLMLLKYNVQGGDEEILKIFGSFEQYYLEQQKYMRKTNTLIAKVVQHNRSMKLKELSTMLRFACKNCDFDAVLKKAEEMEAELFEFWCSEVGLTYDFASWTIARSSELD